jgi:hypothetical protein
VESVEERKNREDAEKKAKEEKRVESRLNKSETEIALVSGDANRFIAEAFVKQKANSGASSKDKSFSRRVLREVKRYEQTGRVSSWLASEFAKAGALRDTTSKKAQEQPESIPISSIGATIPIPNASTDYIFKPIEFTPAPPCVGLGLYTKGQGVWVGAGTIASELPSGFDPEDGKFIASGGSGYAWAEVEIDEETGEIVSVDVEGGNSVPDNTDTKFHYTLGYYEFGNDAIPVTNYGCGSLQVTICRNWFAAEPPYWGVTFNR